MVDATAPHVTLDDVLETLAEPALLLVLDGVTDPHNLGACLRNADAFGAHARHRAEGSRRGAQRHGGQGGERRRRHGAVDHRDQSRARAARSQGARASGSSAPMPAARACSTPTWAAPVAWVLGAEGSGLRRLTRDLCDRIVGIPLSGSVESLNVSVASGICLYAHAPRAAHARVTDAGTGREAAAASRRASNTHGATPVTPPAASRGAARSRASGGPECAGYLYSLMSTP